MLWPGAAAIAKKYGGKWPCQHDTSILCVARVAFVASSAWALAETDEKGFVRITPEKIDWKNRCASPPSTAG
jgi:hypothetical protein